MKSFIVPTTNCRSYHNSMSSTGTVFTKRLTNSALTCAQSLPVSAVIQQLWILIVNVQCQLGGFNH
ncbi:unnamed protein product [Heterobilharzia americana]|nr:unnamed protein product [Heterobilharzia americana]